MRGEGHSSVALQPHLVTHLFLRHYEPKRVSVRLAGFRVIETD
jgi:hypothetical protein